MPDITKAERVIRLHREFPAWTAPKLAREVDCNEAYVRVVAQRYNLNIPRREYHKGGVTIPELGLAAREAGLTVADIRQIARERGL